MKLTRLSNQKLQKEQNQQDFTKISLNFELKRQFANLEDKVMEFIKFSKLLGEFIIVTNATETWIRDCCKIFFPKIYAIYDTLTVKSARDESKFNPKVIPRYPTYDPNDPKEWKYFTMTRNLKAGEKSYLISIGDSMYEADASSEIKHEIGLPDLHYTSPEDVYTIKTVDRSKITGLVHQLDYIMSDFKNLIIKCRESGDIQTLNPGEEHVY